MSEYNLVINCNPSNTIGFACIADLKACAYILKLIPNCQLDSYIINSDGTRFWRLEDDGAQRSLKCINWSAVERGLDEYMQKSTQQTWVINRKDMLIPVIKDALKWVGESTDLTIALSKEGLSKALFK